jgi:HAMP domain
VDVASVAITALTALALGGCVVGVAEASRFADRVGAGELSARSGRVGAGELGRLVASINAMAARLAREQHARPSSSAASRTSANAGDRQ